MLGKESKQIFWVSAGINHSYHAGENLRAALQAFERRFDLGKA